MAYFKYRAVGPDGKICQGVEEVGSAAQLSTVLLQRGMTPLKIEADTKALPVRELKAAPRRTLFKPNTQAQIGAFTRELSIMLAAGMPLDRSLRILGDLSTEPVMARLVASLRDDLRRGKSLAEALEPHPEFNGFYVNMVRAGESGGALEMALGRLATYLERNKELKKTVSAALTYPAILLAVSAISLTVLLGYVVPKFTELFDDMGAALPLPTRVIMAAGDWVAAYWWVLALLVYAVAWLFRRKLQEPDFRAAFDAWVLTLPLAGELVSNLEAARFSRTLATLMHGGVSIVGALSIANGTVSNLAVKQSIRIAGEGLKAGRMLSTGLLDGGYFPTLATHMIQVGEESGQLEEMLSKVADILDEEVSGSVKRLLALLEPVLILGLGGMIAGIIVSVLVGIMGINDLAF